MDSESALRAGNREERVVDPQDFDQRAVAESRE
jgi:hypothetical protein